MPRDFAFKGLESNIWKLKLLSAVYGFMLFVPVIVLFWKQNGLSMTQIMVLQSLYAVSVVILEVPSGYFADRYGRRRTLLLAGFTATLGIGAYSLGYSFIDFLAGELLWSIGMSMISGADSALLYDTLVELGREKDYQDIWGNAKFYFMVSAALASILGGVIGDMQLRWVLYSQVPVIFLMVPVAYSLKEAEHHREVGEEESSSLREILEGALVHDRKLRWLLIFGGFVGAMLQAGFWLYQPYFQLTGLEIAKFGLVFASFNVVSAFASRYADVIENFLGMKNSLIILFVAVGASFLLMSSIVLKLSIAFILIQQFARGFSEPVISDYVNQLTDSGRRSTILSAKSMLGRMIMAVTLPIFGYITDVYSLTQAFSVLAATTVIGGSLFYLLLRAEEMFV